MTEKNRERRGWAWAPGRAILSALLPVFFAASLPVTAGAGSIEWLAPPGAPSSAPARVVSLAPSITEMLFLVGAGRNVAGVTRYDDWPREAAALPKVGGYLDADIEKILALRPSAVLCERNSGLKNTVEKLASMGIPIGVYTTENVASIPEAIEETGALMGRPADGRREAQALKNKLDSVARRVRDLPKPAVIVLYNVTPLMAAGGGTFADGAITLAGGVNAACSSPVAYPVFDIEKLAAIDPDVIIDQSEVVMEPGGKAATPSTVLMSLGSLKAVAKGRVYTMPGDYMFRPGPRIGETIERLAEILHPAKGGGR